jgi:hypothetical protein
MIGFRRKRGLHSSLVNRDARLSFRVRSELKTQLKEIAAQEGRSVAQLCEAFLKAGIEIYEKKGAEYLRALVGHDRSKRSPDA